MNENNRMKRYLLLILLFCNIRAVSQIWNSIPPNDSLFYTVEGLGNDSSWNGYLRCIYIDSSTIIPNGLLNYFYPSVRLDKFDIIDTANGGTWLGKFNIRYNTGDEYFLNQYEDSILIKTFADLNDSWLMCNVNNTEYWATVTSITQISIDGVLDSIKTVSIQAMQNGLPIANYNNNLPLILSKKHGLYQCFELFGFPHKITPTFDINVSYPFPYLPLIHYRLDSSRVNYPWVTPNLLWKFKPGNEWISYWEHEWYKNWGYLHDSIISSQLLTPTSIEVTRYRHSFAKWKVFPQQNSPYDTMGHFYQIFTDTVLQPVFSGKLHPTEQKADAIAEFTPISYRFRWFFLDTFCAKRLILYDTTVHETPVSGGGHKAYKNIEGFGNFRFHWYESQGVALNGYYHFENIVYAKLDSCTYGTKINFKTLELDIIDGEEFISLYPNPASHEIFIKNETDHKILSYKIMDITGKEYNSNKFTNPINVTNLPYGVYLLYLNTNGGILHQKFMKE